MKKLSLCRFALLSGIALLSLTGCTKEGADKAAEDLKKAVGK